jgi:hypothetical protein
MITKFVHNILCQDSPADMLMFGSLMAKTNSPYSGGLGGSLQSLAWILGRDSPYGEDTVISLSYLVITLELS